MCRFVDHLIGWLIGGLAGWLRDWLTVKNAAVIFVAVEQRAMQIRTFEAVGRSEGLKKKRSTVRCGIWHMVERLMVHGAGHLTKAKREHAQALSYAEHVKGSLSKKKK